MFYGTIVRQFATSRSENNYLVLHIAISIKRSGAIEYVVWYEGSRNEEGRL